MQLTYLDTNVYDALSKDDKRKRRILVAKRNGLRIVTSIFNCEEPLLIADTNADTFWRVIDCWRDLASGSGLILSSPKLLDLELEAILTRASLTIEDKLFNRITVDSCYNRLQKCFENGNLNDIEVLRVIEETRNQKEKFQRSITESRERALALKADNPGWRPSLEDYCSSTELSMARSLIERTGYRWELTDDEIKQFLQSRALKLAVRVNLYHVHRQAVVGANPRSGDARDVHHAIASSVADTFVTNDSALRNGLNGVNIPNYRLQSLSDFINSLDG